MPKEPPSRRLWCCLLFLAFLGVATWLWLSRREPARPPISLEFTGETSTGLHLNPFGRFIVRNLRGHPVRWSRAGVEAPQDLDLPFSAGLDSFIPFGTLGPGAQTNFLAMVPHTKGVAFRVLVGYAAEPGLLDRVRAKLPSPLPVIDAVWPRSDVWRTYTSQWFYATQDYTRP